MFSKRPHSKQHRPALSLDIGSLSGRTGLSSSKDQTQTSKRSSFIKVRGSIRGPPLTGIPPAIHGARYRKIEDEGTDQGCPGDDPFDSSFRINQAGPLLDSTSEAGSRILLHLDRSIHYRIAPTAASAWQHHCFDTSLQASPTQSSGSQPDPFSDQNAVASIPRLLLALSVDIVPSTDPTSTGTRENYEFVYFDLDFWTESTISQTCAPDGRSGAKRGQRASLPLVRGFLAGDLRESGFLQTFGPTLYESCGPDVVIIGQNEQIGDRYKLFESRLAARCDPYREGPDSIAARRPDDGTRTVPASPATMSSSSSVAGFAARATAYGTSSIRVMVKRDTLQESAWTARRICFAILLEHSSNISSIEARVKMEASAVRQACVPAASRPTVDFRHRHTWQAKRLSRNPPPSPSAGLGRRDSTAPFQRTRSCEALVRVHPRQDLVSVVSRASGSVKDILFASSLATRRPLPAVQMPVGTKEGTHSSDHIPTVTRPRISHEHRRTQSAQLVPSMYRRTERSSSWSSTSSAARDPSRLVLSRSPDEISEWSGELDQQSLPDGAHTAPRRQSLQSDEGIDRRRSSFVSSVSCRWRQAMYLADQDHPSLQSGYCSAHSPPARGVESDRDAREDDGDIDRLFDMVLTNWTETKLQEQSPPETIVFVATPTAEKRFIPFA